MGTRVIGAKSGSLWAMVAVAGLAACANKPAPPPAIAAAGLPPVVPTVVAAPPPISLSYKQRIANAVIALSAGQSGAARVGLVETLEQKPNDPLASDLLRQIDTDPKVLLGDRSFSYQIRRNETLQMVAKRFLHDPYRFWALARYNDIAVPSSASAGRVIQIPGVAPAPVAPRRAPAAALPATPAAVPATSVAGPSAADVAAASRLRTAGLDQMARGSIDQAVALLQRAATLNPADASIENDLARARKVQAAVRR